MARVATAANEELLLEEARYSTGEQLELICRKYARVRAHDREATPKDDEERRYLTRRDTADGMVRIEAVLHPEEAALVWAAIERVAVERCRERQAADRAAATPSVSGRTADPDADRPIGSAEPMTFNNLGDFDQPITADRHSTSLSSVSPTLVSDDLSAARRTIGSAEPVTSNNLDDFDQQIIASRDSSTPARARPPHNDLPTIGAAEPTRSKEVVPLEEPFTKRVNPRPFDRAEALVEIAHQMLRGTSRDRAPIDLVLSVSVDALSAPRVTVANPPIPAMAPGEPSTAAADATTLGAYLAGRSVDFENRGRIQPSGIELAEVAVLGDGTCISAATARRLACDCGLTAVLEDPKGNPVSIGRKNRTIPGWLKRALLRRDKTCRFPGCTATVFLEGHHREHWADGGETNIGNLLALCVYHHRLVHEYGYKI